MRRLAVVLLLALCACSGGAQPGAGAAGRAADVDALVQAVELIHPEPFGAVSEPAWRRDVADVRARAAAMTADEFLVAVARLANLGDRSGHGGVFPTDQPRLTLWPVRLYEFADGWHVVAAQDASLVGARVEAIGGHPIASVVAAVSPVVPRDNAQSLRARVAAYLVAPAFLRGLHLYGPLTVVDPTGARRDVTPAEVPSGDFAKLVGLDVSQIPTTLTRPSFAPPDDWFWLVRRGDALVAGYERVAAEMPDGRRVQWLVTEIEDAVRVRRPRVLVVDVRRNPGGDVGAAVRLARLLRDVSRAGRVQVRVLISRGTYSATTVMLADLLRDAPRIRTYGEATGGGSRTFGNPGRRTLPASGIVVQVAGAGAAARGPYLPAIEPDVPVSITWAAFGRDRDEVLDAALGR